MWGKIVTATRRMRLPQVLLGLALVLGAICCRAEAQPGDTDPVPQPSEPQPTDLANPQDQDPSASLPVNERSFEEGTIILPADHLLGDWFGRLPGRQTDSRPR